MECVLNVWQLIVQRDLNSQTIQRRKLWIDQAKAASAGQTRVAIVTGKCSLVCEY